MQVITTSWMPAWEMTSRNSRTLKTFLIIYLVLCQPLLKLMSSSNSDSASQPENDGDNFAGGDNIFVNE